MNAKEQREDLFKRLGTIIEECEKKFTTFNKKDHLRLKWGRLEVQAINAYGKLLESAELEQRVETLEQKLKDGVILSKT